MNFQIRNHETGNLIDSFATLADAQSTLTEYIQEDKDNKYYTPDFYEIYDADIDEIVEVA